MPESITGSGAAWVDQVTIPLDGEPVQMVGVSGEGNKQTYQRFADHDEYLLTQVQSVQTDVTSLDSRVTGLETQPIDGGSY
jgi:hypothetical protein